MKQITHKNNFVYLFFSLITLLFSSAIVAEIEENWMEDIFSIVTLVMFIMTIRSIKKDATWRWSLYIIIMSFVVLTILSKIFSHDLYAYLILLILLIFFVGAFSATAKQILFTGDIDLNKLIGSLTLYILLGLIWATIYMFILAVEPQSFSGIEYELGNWREIFSHVSYYSFVTLTTLGYGDILPTNNISEFFVYMESIVGVFYMAIIVSSLISLHISAINKNRL